jgi:hypothetical protein
MEVRKIIFILIVSLFTSSSLAKAPAREYMSPSQAETRWGKAPFDVKKFKSGNEATRASMVVSLIVSKAFIGKPFKDIRKELGDPDGYFENKAIPAYLLSTKEKDIWQVIFLPDDKWEKVDEVRIHKNCCD